MKSIEHERALGELLEARLTIARLEAEVKELRAKLAAMRGRTYTRESFEASEEGE